jgi:hypothetical protein
MENFKREIFEQLGKLFYAVASDQHVSAMASGELKMLLRKDWLTERERPSEDKVSEAAHLIGLTVDTLAAGQVPGREAFSDFAAFYRIHQEQFSSALKQRILETAESIVKIFPDSGKKNAHIQELKMLFSQSPMSSEVRQ